jgi:phosphate:Na+ symporter
VTAGFHVAFNVVLAALFIGLLGPLARLLERYFPARAAAANPNMPRHLDPSALDTPSLRWPTQRVRRCIWATWSR